MAENTHAPTRSDSWQPDYIARNQAAQSEYLQRVSATTLLQQVAARAMAMLALAPGDRVLEVGCGNGVFLPGLAAAVGDAGRVVGIDHAETFVAEARTRIATADLTATVTVELGDACKLPYADASFDAAHCERVLMHLPEPQQALTEMARVVRPGGCIVVAEPDWAGFRIDHPDRAGMDKLYARAMRQRQPHMGLTAYRRMGEIGLVDRRAEPVLAVIIDYDGLRNYGLALAPAADELVADGSFSRETVDALLAALDEAQASGRFYCTALMHVVAGRVPA